MTVALVTLGETMAVVASPGVGPLRHARSLDLGVAGAESTVAIGASRLGVRAAWLGRLGDDEFGALVRMTLAGQGIDLRGVVTDLQAPTGLMIKERRSSSITRVSYRRTDSAGSRLSPDDLDQALLDAAAVLHVSGITSALSASARSAVHAAVERARAARVLVSVDINHRRALWSHDEAVVEYRWLVEHADVLFATESEARMLVAENGPEALAAALAALGPAEVIVKRGESGASAVIDGASLAAPVFSVVAVDPVGAGDAFAAGYLAERVRGAGPEQRLRTAAAAGAFAVTAAGDWEGLPSPADLAQLGAADVQR